MDNCLVFTGTDYCLLAVWVSYEADIKLISCPGIERATHLDGNVDILIEICGRL